MKRNLLILVLGCILGLYQPLNAQDAENVVNGHEYVDLALPSGLKWATCNVGASSPEKSGSYFAWGETKPKDEYTSANSLTYGKEIDDISGNVQYDAAAANWGEGWRMPTKDEMQELIDNCDWEWTKQNNVKGYKVTGVNGNSIFIPETGNWERSEFTSGSCGYSAYWSSSPNSSHGNYYFLRFSNSGLSVGYGSHLYGGCSIRPVRDREDVIETPFVAAMVEHYTDVTAIIKTYVASPGAEITERGFYYGTNPEPAETDNKVVLENEVGYITKVLLDLTPNTTYYVKAYATNSAGTSYSEVVSFTTLAESAYNDYVDLGLPSGLKWATHNIGATSPSEYGDYYAWGEVFTKDKYTEANSLTYGKPMDDISGTEYDAATANWGGDWRMPTDAEMQELRYHCTWTWTTQKGVYGYKVTSKTNGNSIFLPAAGCRYVSYPNGLNGEGSDGSYCSSTPTGNGNYNLYFNSSSCSVGVNNRYFGYSIRPVIEVVEKPTVSASVENYTDLTAIIKTFVSSSAEITERGFYYGTNPEPAETDNKVVLENGVGYITKALVDLTPNTTYYIKSYATNSEGTSYSEVVSFTTLAESAYNDYVDLGLPSGLKWATHNIGATSPSEYGNYYAWGEVFTKKYEYTEASSLTYGKPMDDISGTEYDAATFNWGGDWRMPTYTEMQELIDNCTWTWTTHKGVNGYKVTSKTNGNSIFLPAAGYCDGQGLYRAGDYGHYWSSTPYNNSCAHYLIFYSGTHSVSEHGYRYLGRTVRPVRE